MIIREIKKEDNKAIENIIKDNFISLGLPLKGTAFEDIEITQMFQTYKKERDKYFIIEVDGKVMGGVGFQQLPEPYSNTCEIQKMYFSGQIKGLGYGKIIFKHCLLKAKELNYQQCYIETIKTLQTAIHIYKKNDFQILDHPLIDTGHNSCDVWMLKNL